MKDRPEDDGQFCGRRAPQTPLEGQENAVIIPLSEKCALALLSASASPCPVRISNPSGSVG